MSLSNEDEFRRQSRRLKKAPQCILFLKLQLKRSRHSSTRLHYSRKALFRYVAQLYHSSLRQCVSKCKQMYPRPLAKWKYVFYLTSSLQKVWHNNKRQSWIYISTISFPWENLSHPLWLLFYLHCSTCLCEIVNYAMSNGTRWKDSLKWRTWLISNISNEA